MSKRKDIRSCPNCGSRNLQTEGRSKKGRRLFICAECNHEFELRIGDMNSHRSRRGEKQH